MIRNSTGLVELVEPEDTQYYRSILMNRESEKNYKVLSTKLEQIISNLESLTERLEKIENNVEVYSTN